MRPGRPALSHACAPAYFSASKGNRPLMFNLFWSGIWKSPQNGLGHLHGNECRYAAITIGVSDNFELSG
jgi:hypothetical protein